LMVIMMMVMNILSRLVQPLAYEQLPTDNSTGAQL
jgi:hypothetical protein